jgi:sucrose-6-phosphate hydrolase SacC (GH32 family)
MSTQNPVIARAIQSVAAAEPVAAADPARPVYHFRPPAQWMNDPNGVIYHNGWYHVFYQHNPYGDEWGHMHWGHTRSRDLVYWEQLPIGLWPSLERGEEHCFSGCAAVNDQGQPMLLYTSVHGRGPHSPPNEQWAALGDPDWITWEKHPANPILALANHGGPPFEGDWRDPFVFHADGRTFLVLGAVYNDIAEVPLYEALDGTLTRWRYCGPLYQQPRVVSGLLECPNFAQLGEQWILLTSPYRPVEYLVGSFDVASLTFMPEQRGVLDPGASEVPNYYATNILFDDQDRCILLGWVRGFPKGRGWNGCLALPRILTLGADGHPRQQPVPELQRLRGRSITVPDGEIALGGKAIEGVRGAALEIEVELKLEQAEAAGLRFGSTHGAEDVIVRFDGPTLTVAGTAVAWPERNARSLRLHLFLDHSVLEVFASDGRVAVTRVIDGLGENSEVTLFAEGGSAYLHDCTVWEMASIW